MTLNISCRSLIKIELQIPRWRTKRPPCKGMAVSQAFMFHVKWYSLLHFALCQHLCWDFLFTYWLLVMLFPFQSIVPYATKCEAWGAKYKRYPAFSLALLVSSGLWCKNHRREINDVCYNPFFHPQSISKSIRQSISALKSIISNQSSLFFNKKGQRRRWRTAKCRHFVRHLGICYSIFVKFLQLMFGAITHNPVKKNEVSILINGSVTFNYSVSQLPFCPPSLNL